MKAIMQSRYGGSDVLELAELAEPVLGDRDVLVRVVAAGVDYTVDDVTASGTRFDAILDLAGNRPLGSLSGILGARGTLVLGGGESGGEFLGGLERNLAAGFRSRRNGQRMIGLFATENPADLEELRSRLESGELRPAVDAAYPLAQAGAALDRLRAGGVAGKIVLRIS